MSFNHSITVVQLRKLLHLLRDDDVLVPNKVQNFAVFRDGVYVGFINLLDGCQQIELHEKINVATENS